MLDVAQIADIALAAVVKRYRLYREDLVDHYVFKHYLCTHYDSTRRNTYQGTYLSPI